MATLSISIHSTPTKRKGRERLMALMAVSRSIELSRSLILVSD
ncbi:MAG: hypothetical protein EWM72_00146 [Nitrospira sp.]|nr:MAG: hypothetical protein EWM72_00146 [Nitrospira sp.]